MLKGVKSLDAETAKKIEEHYMSNEHFNTKYIEKNISVPAAGLCEWVHALYEYYNVMLDV